MAIKMVEFFENFLGVEFTTKYIISQIIGFIAMALVVYSYQEKKQSRILSWQFRSGILFAISYFFQGGYTGMMMNVIGAGRSFVYSRCENKQWANSIFFPIGFNIAFTVSTIFTWEGWYSMLPLAALVATTLAYRSTNATLVRVVAFPCSVCWLIYNAIIGNISGVATEILDLSSIIIGFCRHDIPKLKTLKQKKETD